MQRPSDTVSNVVYCIDIKYVRSKVVFTILKKNSVSDLNFLIEFPLFEQNELMGNFSFDFGSARRTVCCVEWNDVETR